MAGTFDPVDPLTAAINAITLGGGTSGGYGGYGGTPTITGASIAGFGTGITGGTPSVYTPQFAPGYQNPAIIDPLKTGTTPSVTNPADPFSMKDLFSKDGMGLVLGGLQTIGGLWGAWKANQLAEKQFDFAKEFAEKNLANQTASYNTALEDRGRSRELGEGRDPQEARDYVERNRLS